MLFKRTIARIERRRFAAKIHALILVATMVLVGSVALPACGSQETDLRADAGAPLRLIPEPALAGETAPPSVGVDDSIRQIDNANF